MPELTQVPPAPNPEITNPNMRYFKRLGVTDPRYTKSFKRHGGFTGTAINPTYCCLRMTELFGPVGDGWGVEVGELKFIDCFEKGGNELLVYSSARVWYRIPLDPPPAASATLEASTATHKTCFTPWCWGGDVVMNKTKDGYVRSDDEALKKAQTDAMMKCFTFIGLAADVHLGLYDDSKYVAFIQGEFEQEKEEKRKARPKPAAQAAAPPAAPTAEPPPAPAPAPAPQPPPPPTPPPSAPAPAAAPEPPPLPPIEATAPAWVEGPVVKKADELLGNLLANGAITEASRNQAKALLENMAINAHDAGYKDEKIEDWLLKVVDPLATGSRTFQSWLTGAASAADSMAEVAQKAKARG